MIFTLLVSIFATALHAQAEEIDPCIFGVHAVGDYRVQTGTLGGPQSKCFIYLTKVNSDRAYYLRHNWTSTGQWMVFNNLGEQHRAKTYYFIPPTHPLGLEISNGVIAITQANGSIVKFHTEQHRFVSVSGADIHYFLESDDGFNDLFDFENPTYPIFELPWYDGGQPIEDPFGKLSILNQDEVCQGRNTDILNYADFDNPVLKIRTPTDLDEVIHKLCPQKYQAEFKLPVQL